MDYDYELNPEQQEIDWNGCGIRLVRCLYLFTFLCLLSSALVVPSKEGVIVLRILALWVLALTLGAFLYQVYKIVGEYYHKRWLNTKKHNKALSLKHDDFLRFLRHGNPYMEVPVDDIQEIHIQKDETSNMKAIDAGYGFVLSSLNNVRLEDEKDYVELVKNIDQKGAHIWIDSLEVGSENQNENFENWIRNRVPDNKIIVFTQEQWSRLDWIFLFGAVAIACLVGSIIYFRS